MGREGWRGGNNQKCPLRFDERVSSDLAQPGNRTAIGNMGFHFRFAVGHPRSCYRPERGQYRKTYHKFLLRFPLRACAD
jgi:hypothetical protein